MEMIDEKIKIMLAIEAALANMQLEEEFDDLIINDIKNIKDKVLVLGDKLNGME